MGDVLLEVDSFHAGSSGTISSTVYSFGHEHECKRYILAWQLGKHTHLENNQVVCWEIELDGRQLAD